MEPALGAIAAVLCFAPFLYIEEPFLFPITYLLSLPLLMLMVSLAILAGMTYRRQIN